MQYAVVMVTIKDARKIIVYMSKPRLILEHTIVERLTKDDYKLKLIKYLLQFRQKCGKKNNGL